jgi:hypothetical protein
MDKLSTFFLFKLRELLADQRQAENFMLIENLWHRIARELNSI